MFVYTYVFFIIENCVLAVVFKMKSLLICFNIVFLTYTILIYLKRKNEMKSQQMTWRSETMENDLIKSGNQGKITTHETIDAISSLYYYYYLAVDLAMPVPLRGFTVVTMEVQYYLVEEDAVVILISSM